MHQLYWIALSASLLSLGLTIYTAHRNLLLFDFFLVFLALVAAGGSAWQLLTGKEDFLKVYFIIVVNLLLSYRLTKLPARKE